MRFKGAQFQYIWNDKPIYKLMKKLIFFFIVCDL
jgi:hypothetical protein